MLICYGVAEGAVRICYAVDEGAVWICYGVDEGAKLVSQCPIKGRRYRGQDGIRIYPRARPGTEELSWWSILLCPLG